MRGTLNLVICMDGSGSMGDTATDTNKRDITIPRRPLQALAIKALLQILYKEIGHKLHLNVSLTKQLDHRREVEVLLKDKYLRDEDILHNIFATIDNVKSDSNTDLHLSVSSMIDIAKEQVGKTTGSYAICLMYTDGEDTHASYADLARSIQGMPISINTVGISTQCDFLLLSKIADAFDGFAMFAYDHNSLVDTARHLALAITKATERGSWKLETPDVKREPMAEIEDDDMVAALLKAIDVWLKVATMQNSEFNEMNQGGRSGVNGRLLAEFKDTPDYDEVLKALALKSEYKSWGLKWLLGLRMQYKKWICMNKNDKLPQQFKHAGDDEFLERSLSYCDDETYFKPLVATPIPNWRPFVYQDDYKDAADYKKQMEMLSTRAEKDKAGRALFGGVSICNVRGSARVPTCFDVNTPILRIPDPVQRPGYHVFCPAKDLKRGDYVYSRGCVPARVEKIFITKASTLKRVRLVRDGQVLEITSNHPIVDDATQEWIWPKDSVYAVDEGAVVSEESKPMDVCSIMLTPDDTDIGCNWVMTAGGFRVITLGHNIRDDEVAEHVFYGNMRALNFYAAYLTERFPQNVDVQKGTIVVTQEAFDKFMVYAEPTDITVY